MMKCKKQFKSRLTTIVYPFFYLLTILICLTAFKSITASAAPEDQKVYDYYGLFTEDEVSELEATCKEYGEEGKVDIVIVTTDELDGRTRQQYLEDFFDEYGFGYNQKAGDAALILINMDSSNRGVEIQGYGNAEYNINNERINHILDDITPMLSDGKNYKAIVNFQKQVAFYMTHIDSSDHFVDTDNLIYFNIFFQLAVALVIGAVVVIIMALQSGGKVTVNNRTYLDEQNSRVVANQDYYISTTITKVKKPTNNNSSGGGGGGVSSGGSSHSGGGRSF